MYELLYLSDKIKLIRDNNLLGMNVHGLQKDGILFNSAIYLSVILKELKLILLLLELGAAESNSATLSHDVSKSSNMISVLMQELTSRLASVQH